MDSHTPSGDYLERRKIICICGLILLRLRRGLDIASLFEPRPPRNSGSCAISVLLFTGHAERITSRVVTMVEPAAGGMKATSRPVVERHDKHALL